jgi:hypothetical protein
MLALMLGAALAAAGRSGDPGCLDHQQNSAGPVDHGGHKRPYSVTRGIGLVGQMKATTAGPEFEKAMHPILAAAGPLPHCKLHLNVGASSHSSRGKRPYSGRIRCACGNCGYTVHTTRKWLNLAGAPLCPNRGPMDVSSRTTL